MRGRLGLLGLDAEQDLIADQSTLRRQRRRTKRAPGVPRSGVRAVGREGRRAGAGREGDRTPPRHALRAVRDPLDAAPRDRRRGDAEIVRLTDRPVPAPEHAREASGAPRSSVGPGPARRCSPPRRHDASRARASARCSSASTRPLARMLAETTADVAAGPGLLDVTTFHQLCQDLGREAGVLGERPDPVPQPWWDADPPRRARRGRRAAGASIPRDRRRRGPGLRARLAARARGAVVRWPRGRAVRVPRPGAGHLPRGRRGAAGPAGVPARAELPERAADPSTRRAVRPGRASSPRRCAARAASPSSSRPMAMPPRSRRCARSSIDCGSRRTCRRGRSPS